MMKLLRWAAGKLTAIPPNRVVVFLTPVFAAASGWLAAWVPQHLPALGYNPSREQITVLFVAGTAAGVAATWKWLTGWQRNERFEADLVLDQARAAAVAVGFTSTDIEAIVMGALRGMEARVVEAISAATVAGGGTASPGGTVQQQAAEAIASPRTEPPRAPIG